MRNLIVNNFRILYQKVKTEVAYLLNSRFGIIANVQNANMTETN